MPCKYGKTTQTMFTQNSKHRRPPPSSSMLVRITVPEPQKGQGPPPKPLPKPKSPERLGLDPTSQALSQQGDPLPAPLNPDTKAPLLAVLIAGSSGPGNPRGSLGLVPFGPAHPERPPLRRTPFPLRILPSIRSWLPWVGGAAVFSQPFGRPGGEGLASVPLRLWQLPPSPVVPGKLTGGG
jgi:hypothetical protein